jgi:hypothetical protein
MGVSFFDFSEDMKVLIQVIQCHRSTLMHTEL